MRVGELDTVLRCEGSAGDELTLELEGPGEAVLLACVGSVPLEAAAAAWEQRAVTTERVATGQRRFVKPPSFG